MSQYTPEQVLDLLDELTSASEMIGYATSGAERNNHKATRDKIKAEIIAYLTQPARAVDVGAIEQVATELWALPFVIPNSRGMANKLTRALACESAA